MGYVLVALCSLTIGSELSWAQETSDSNSLISPKQAQVVSSKKQFGGLQNLKQYSLDTQGTGIVAYNFGKSMEDIKALNGDEQAAKEMILYESGATGYSLMGDVTDKIQVGDLGDLFSTSSNDLAQHHVTLTVPAQYSGTGKELSTDVIIYTGKVVKISNWQELSDAIVSSDAAIVDVQNNMINTDNKDGADKRILDERKDFVFLGNGYSLDFRETSYYWWTSTSLKHNVWIDNADLYGKNFYGPITMRDYFVYESTVNYRNVSYHGSQVTASFGSTIQFYGKNYIKSAYPNYTSFDGSVIRVTPGEGQAGLESHTLRFKEDSDTVIETDDGNGIAVGGWWSNGQTVTNIQPSLTVEKDAKALVRTLGNGGENTSWQMDGTSTPSVLSIHRNGRI